jgi:hypothetical protein
LFDEVVDDVLGPLVKSIIVRKNLEKTKYKYNKKKRNIKMIRKNEKTIKEN